MIFSLLNRTKQLDVREESYAFQFCCRFRQIFYVSGCNKLYIFTVEKLIGSLKKLTLFGLVCIVYPLLIKLIF